MVRRLLIVAVAAGAALGGLFAQGSGAQQYPPAMCSLSLSASVVVPGQTIIASTVNCDPGFAAGATVTITLESPDPVVLTTTTADANGQFSTPITIPPDTSLGAHRVVASGTGADGSTLVISAKLTVVSGEEAAAPGPARPVRGALPVTGSDSLPLLWIALACLTVGTAVVLAARRRAEARRRLSA